MTLPARRPWWKKKRWATALALWFVVAGYPVSLGPQVYAVRRGWLPQAVVPWKGSQGWRPRRSLPGRYLQWWDDVAFRHATRRDPSLAW